MNDVLSKILQKFDDVKKSVEPYFYGFPLRRKGKKISLYGRLDQASYFDRFWRLTDLFGSPLFVHSYFGYVWKLDEAIVAYTILPKGYDDESLEIFVLETMPRGEKLQYDQYERFDQMVRDVFEQYDLRCDSLLHYGNFGSKQFMYMVSNDRLDCMLTIGKRSMQIYFRRIVPTETGMKESIPDGHIKRKIGYTDRKQIESFLETALARRSEKMQ